ncbi:MAG TPA: hypothetical protein VH682_23330 [Gemmataceae bacterium]
MLPSRFRALSLLVVAAMDTVQTLGELADQQTSQRIAHLLGMETVVGRRSDGPVAIALASG